MNARQAVQLIDPAHPEKLEHPELEVLGSKAYHLACMVRAGLPVPPAFVIGTGWCAAHEGLNEGHWREALRQLERITGLGFGDRRHPLVVSVRSGAPVSMPGMMETLLNIGLTEQALPGVIRQTGHPRLAWDAYRRLIAAFGEVVAGIDGRCFESDLKAVTTGGNEFELDFSQLRELSGRHLETFRREYGTDFPQDPTEQLSTAIRAVLASWDSDKARSYRARHDIDSALGTAVTVQQMVFGNAGGLSGAGVGFTRHPSTGAPEPWVDFLFNAQGEDVVSGRRNARGDASLRHSLPSAWATLREAMATLEQTFGDMQDFEFTVRGGRLYLLQSRSGKRTPIAAARIALDLFGAGVISRQQALERSRNIDAGAVTISVLANEHGDAQTPLATGATASSGVASGPIVFDEEQAQKRSAEGQPGVLIKPDAETRDTAVLEYADALVTRRGARTAHAAVVARQLGKVCVVGCEALEIDPAAGTVKVGERILRTGDLVTVDGNEGRIYAGALRIEKRLDESLWRRLETFRRAG